MSRLTSVLESLKRREAVISVLSTIAALGLIQFVNDEEMRTVAEALALLAGSMQYLVAFVMRQSGEKQVAAVQSRSLESSYLSTAVQEIRGVVSEMSEELQRIQSRLDQLESDWQLSMTKLKEMSDDPD